MMKEDELADILTEHADALNDGKDITTELADKYPDPVPELASLLQTAEQLKAALTPISAPAFKTQLRKRLNTYTPSEVVVRPPAPGTRMLWLVVAATGSLLSMVGLSVVLLRRLRAAGEVGTQAVTTTA